MLILKKLFEKYFLIVMLYSAIFAGEVVAKTFDHQMTNFPLDGQHTVLECQDCHQNGVFRGTPNQCELCHSNTSSIESTAKSLNHIKTENQCEDCHTTQSWSSVFRVSHQSLSTDCSSCHNDNEADGKGDSHVATTEQ